MRSIESRKIAIVLILCLLFLFLVSPATSAVQDPFAEAQRLRNSRQFAAAVKLLDAHLDRFPDDAEAARLRAQTLYWLNDLVAARSRYAEALKRHPEHEGLRVEYARMLAETGDRAAAVALLKSAAARGSTSADALALLGTILYWEGDFTGAKRHFEEALRRNPAQADAARQLQEIRIVASPWLRLAPSIWHDDQPLDNLGLAIEGGWFITPLLTVAVRSEPLRYSTEADRTFWRNELELSHSRAARVETRLAIGAFRRPDAIDRLDWTGRASLRLRPSRVTAVGVRVERAPYLSTTASLATPVFTTSIGGSVHVDASGWRGEAALQRDTFPDDNAVLSAYAWGLAPLIEREAATLQAGYAIGLADADENRFVLARPQQPFPPSDPRYDFSGVYDPYFTPANSVTHSAIAAIRVGRTSGPVLRAGGSLGFHAREDATSFSNAGGQVTAGMFRRSFRPWTLRASVDIPASPSVVFTVAGVAGASAYYRWTTASAEITYRFIPSSTRGDGRR